MRRFKVMLFQENSQLSSCILHLCVSIGNNVRSSGQERVMDNLEEEEENSVFPSRPVFVTHLYPIKVTQKLCLHDAKMALKKKPQYLSEIHTRLK